MHKDGEASCVEENPNHENGDAESRFLRLPEVEKRTGIKKSALYAMISNQEFPAPIPITRGAVGWVEAEVNAFIERRIRLRRRGRGSAAGGW